MDDKQIEDIVEDPVKVYDFINERIWKDPSDPITAAFISEYRKYLCSETGKARQYKLVVGYMFRAGAVTQLLSNNAFDDGKAIWEFLDAIQEKLKGKY